MQEMFGANPKGFGTHHPQLTHPSSSRIPHSAHAPLSLMVAPSHMWAIQWLVCDVWGGEWGRLA